ncbi:hypothetical protein CMK12_17520, partial [Candidatus Poribacteria bacterium]|nr:hypothetical protein [Candidatus Poribacteria bacterium]
MKKIVFGSTLAIDDCLLARNFVILLLPTEVNHLFSSFLPIWGPGWDGRLARLSLVLHYLQVHFFYY